MHGRMAPRPDGRDARSPAPRHATFKFEPPSGARAQVAATDGVRRRFVAYFQFRDTYTTGTASCDTPPRVVGTPRGYARAGGRTRPESVRPSSAGGRAVRASSARGSPNSPRAPHLRGFHQLVG